MKRTVAISSLFVGAAVIIACSKNQPAVKASVSTSTTPADAGAPPPDAGVLTNGPPPPVDAGAPVMPPFFTNTDAGAPATPPPAMTDQAADVAIDAILAATATKNAPKMTEVAPVGRQTMKEGDHLVMMINLEPNKCYTIIGTSLPGMVTKLDLQLLGPPFYNVAAGASGKDDKALPIIAKGAAALCPISPVALPYKLDAVAAKGAGRIGVKVYVRAK